MPKPHITHRIFFLVFFLSPSLALSQQKILLVGTLHRTPDGRLGELIPISKAIENFRPEIFLTEYIRPTDTASLQYRYGPAIFQQRDSIGKRWNIAMGDLNSKIKALQCASGLLTDIEKQIDLQQLYFLSLDDCNADYFGYNVMSSVENDEKKVLKFRATFPGFVLLEGKYLPTLSGINDKAYVSNEYYKLVFPLAAKLRIRYLYPIDDLSSWKEYEKYYDRLQTSDPTNADKMKFRRRSDDFRRKLSSLPADSSEWLFANSQKTMRDLLRIEGYQIDADVKDEDIKALHNYWVLRNKTMASYIHINATEHADKNIVVFFGVSHVGPVLEELAKMKKDYQVLTLPDVFGEFHSH